jgi:hypothetical protein
MTLGVEGSGDCPAWSAPGITEVINEIAVFAAYMPVDGAFAIASSVRAARRHERWGFLVLNGIVNIAAGYRCAS